MIKKGKLFDHLIETCAKAEAGPVHLPLVSIALQRSRIQRRCVSEGELGLVFFSQLQVPGYFGRYQVVSYMAKQTTRLTDLLGVLVLCPGIRWRSSTLGTIGEVPTICGKVTVGLFFFPQQRKLLGSSAQISSGVCRRGSQEQVPEEGSGGRFRKVPACAGVGSRGRVLVCVPEGVGEFRCVLV